MMMRDDVNILQTENVEERTEIIESREKKINYGDLVFIFESRDSIKFMILERGKLFQNKYGVFKHDDMFGKTYGTRITGTISGKFITILDYVPYLWERCLNRFTQILFNADISLIMTFLNIRSDSIIYESGTGSGCLSTNISQVLNEGHLYTFEFNKERQDKQKDVFKMIGLEKKVTILHRDVVEYGFEVEMENLVESEHSKCDGIFIDLPSPWLIVEKAKNVLKTGGSFVSFSPCIEQVEKTMKTLRDSDFINTRMFEIPNRNHSYSSNVKIRHPHKKTDDEKTSQKIDEFYSSNSRTDMRGHTGFLIYAIKL